MRRVVPLDREYLGLNRSGDAARDLVLQVEDVDQLAVEAFGPDVIAGQSFNELDADA